METTLGIAVTIGLTVVAVASFAEARRIRSASDSQRFAGQQSLTI
jgi:hypothetical protein